MLPTIRFDGIAILAINISWSNAPCLCVYLCVLCLSHCVAANRGGTSRNRCTHRLVIMHHRPTNEP